MKDNFAHNHWIKMIIDCIIELQTHNVRLEFSKKQRIKLLNDNSLCHGYWDDTDPKKPILACSIKGPVEEWGPIFAHEFGHFQQWRDRTDIWKNNNKITAYDQYAIINNFPISEKKLIKAINCFINIELDAEKRAVKLFKKYNIPIDIEQYIKGANLYIFFQRYLYWYRKWCQSQPPYKIPELLSLVKPAFYRNYENISNDLFEGFKKYYPPCKNPKLLL